ncbi:PD-(D/E)XK nuclease family protein [Nitrosopumilus sp.]|uniref:PD-(D/E)XK nuclease family protein n=1 Tax=Nitrosopumilus sp. TaxID=2024843 RepID=UPI00247DC072|nr:PD-(D/E)XK nuclease family protein [Nitrosopumilus sp.]MCV0409376.1 PD-(D/E)XK nuclease family protein [Nitrosopumilus sp.]
MIKVNKENDIAFLTASVTDFADSLGYCNYKIPLYIQGVKPKPSASLILGTKAHHEEEKYEQELAELEPVSFEQIEDKQKNIEFARENIYSSLSIPFEFPSENVLVSLSGRIDKILRIDETLVIQDDKFTGRPQTYDAKTQPYPSQLLQVLAYLNSNYSAKRTRNPEDFFEMPHTQKKWQIRICDSKTRKPYKVFSDFQDSFSLHYLHSSLEKFAAISLGIAPPEHHNNVNKCNACNLKSFCSYKI